jgi:hypothetical protein
MGSLAASGVAGVASDVDYKANVVRVGLNYKFSGPIFSRDERSGSVCLHQLSVAKRAPK